MFVQVIQGTVKDEGGLRKQMDLWKTELKPGAEGYLGSTGGITPDGRFITLARFESEEAAQRSSDRPEQGKWWAETEKFIGNPQFTNYTNVETYMGGGSDEAGFVQIMQGGIKPEHLEKARAMYEEMLVDMPSERPDIFGMLSCFGEDGSFTDAIYFRSEKEAREGEAKMENDPKSQEEMAQFQEIATGPPTFFDLLEPQLDTK